MTTAPWRVARVLATRPETPRVRTIVLDVDGWPGHRAGQHVDVRLTAEDGYQAQRSYSVASAPGAPNVELTVEMLDDGEVSSHLTGEARAGDLLEVRGPIGGYFVWEARLRSRLVLIAGGSGIVPLMSMLRHRAAAGSTVPTRLLYSARAQSEIIYREELAAMAARDPSLTITYTLTRERPADWSGFSRRTDRGILDAVVPPPDVAPLIYVCGPTSMVELVAHLLVEAGHVPSRVRTERFGPTAST